MKYFSPETTVKEAVDAVEELCELKGWHYSIAVTADALNPAEFTSGAARGPADWVFASAIEHLKRR